ncbi:MAG: hypothetical protein IIC52_07950 [Proteobacteria bacterium]|nr:hypothetical protein [Pseudomonadota bacterium]
MKVPAKTQDLMPRMTREQCYLCIMRKNEAPPKQTKTPDELRVDHHDYLLDLERRGILFGAGPFRDGDGWAADHGVGMVVVRAKDREEAEATAFQEPFTKAGWYFMEVMPWIRNEGAVNIQIRFADGVLQVDRRRYGLSQQNQKS